MPCASDAKNSSDSDDASVQSLVPLMLPHAIVKTAKTVDLLEMRKTDSFKVLPLMLVTDHMSHYPKAKLCDFVPLT